MSLSDAVVFCALRQAAGLSFSKDPDAFCSFLNLSPDPAEARQIGKSETCCGTTVRACLWRAGVDGGPGLSDPYRLHIGSVFGILEGLAQKQNAWKAHPAAEDIQPGSVVFVDGPAHVFIVTRRDGDTVETVEGGQVDPGNPPHCTAIHAKTRLLARSGEQITLGGRDVVGCFAVDDLVALSSTRDPAAQGT